MFTNIYKKLIIDFPKFTLSLIFILLAFSTFYAKNFNLDASSDALILEGDKDLNYLRQVNERYGSKDFLILTYSPITSFEEKETHLRSFRKPRCNDTMLVKSMQAGWQRIKVVSKPFIQR